MAYFTRSRAREGHKAAGVLPFALHEGVVLVLLGGEPCKTGPGGKVWRTMWRDFGGCREAADASSEATAAREFAEETLGLFGACGVDAASVALAAAEMEARLQAPGRAVKVVHALKSGSYVFFVTQQPFVAPLMFRLASQQNAATGAVAGGEKSGFAWVPMRALLECVAAAAPRYFFETHVAYVCGGPDTPHRLQCGKRRFQLHPCFASSLRMAQSCGLEELVAQAQELPLPPPPLAQPLLLLPPAAAPPEPAASVQGGGAAAAAGAAAVDSAAAGAACGAGTAEESADEEDEDAESSGCRERGRYTGGMQESVAYWLAQEEVASALRSGGTPPAAAPAAAAAVAGPGPASSSQLRAPFVAGWGRPQVPTASVVSLAPASSLDTASSLRASRQAAVAAAVGEVVQQIEANSHSCCRHRLSRKQRQKRRRQRQQQQAAVAAQAAASLEAAAAQAAASLEAAELAAATAAAAAASGAAAAGAASLPGSPAGRCRQRCFSSGAEHHASPAAQALLVPLPPPHWQQAQRELEAAFQPHLRLHKRQRVAVAAV